MDEKELSNIIEVEMPGYELVTDVGNDTFAAQRDITIAPPPGRWQSEEDHLPLSEGHLQVLTERFFGPEMALRASCV